MLSRDQITTIYYYTDEMLKAFGKISNPLAHLSDGEIITVALVACADFGGVMQYGMDYLYQYGYIRTKLHKSQLSRRLQALEPYIESIFQGMSFLLVQLLSCKKFILDSTTLEVCDNIRICRCRLLLGEEFRGYKASFRRYFYGLRLQLLCTEEGIPVDYMFTEAAMHDGEAMKLMQWLLSPESIVYSDAAYTDYGFEDRMALSNDIEWLSQRKSNSKRPYPKTQRLLINKSRKRIETVFSSLKNLFKRKIQTSNIEGYMRKIKCFLLCYQLKSLL